MTAWMRKCQQMRGMQQTGDYQAEASQSQTNRVN